jgi:hypothetical protein
VSDKPDDVQLTAILEHLPGWRHNEHYAAYHWCAGIIDDAGHDVSVELEKGRLRFVGQFPGYGDESQTISVKADRTAEKIASEFSRRFLPGYLAQWVVAKARVDKQQEYAIDTETARRKLAQLPGMRASQDSKTLYGPNCTILNVQGPDSIRLECRGNFTVKQIKRILKVLQ